MNKNELEKVINERIKKLELCIQENNNIIELKKYVLEEAKSELYFFPDLDLKKLVCAYLIYIQSVYEEELNYNEAEEIFEEVMNYITESSTEKIANAYSFMRFSAFGYAERCTEYFKNGSQSEKKEIINLFIKDSKKNQFEESIINETINSFDVIEKMREDIPKFFDLFVRKRCDSDLLFILFIIENKTIIERERSRRKPEYFNKAGIEDFEKYIRFYTMHIQFSKGIVELSKKYFLAHGKKFHKNIKVLNNEIDCLNNLLIILNENIDMEIKDIEKFINIINDLNIKKKILEYVLEHNNLVNEELIKKIQYIKNDVSSSYKSLFTSNGINISNFDIKKLFHHDKCELENMIILLKGFLIKNTKVFLNVLSVTNLDIVSSVMEWFNKNFISTKFILDNVDIFSNIDKFNLISDNIKLMNNYEINPKIFIENNDILLSNTKLLEYNFEVLREYDLLKSLKTSKEHLFLLDECIYTKIDRLCELGYISYLKEDLNILNNKNLKRLEVLHSLDINLNNKTDFYNVISSDKKFIINDNEIDMYILNIYENMEKQDLNITLDNLEKYRISNSLYSIDGVLISTKKVDRLVNMGYSLYDAIFFGMRVNDIEYFKIINELKCNINSMK